MTEPKLRVISLGAGVQSTTLALMAASGEVGPMPDCAIFADTGWEPTPVYDHLAWLSSSDVLPFPVHRAQRAGADLGQMALEIAAGSRPLSGNVLPPLYTSNPKGMLPKQCSKEFKTRVVGRAVREMLGYQPRQRIAGLFVEQWIGISSDEITRMKDAEQPWVRNRFPLIEMRMRREHCLAWLRDHDYPEPPKSACIFCPFTDNARWKSVLDHPIDGPKAIAFDKAIRHVRPTGEAFVHRRFQPLDEVDMSTSSDRGQFEFGFLSECEGHCGV